MRVARRITRMGVTLALASFLSIAPAAGQEPASGTAAGSASPLDEARVVRPAESESRPGADLAFAAERLPAAPARRPRALVPLYGSLAVFQVLDVHSTRRGLAAGGREANPLMRPVVRNGAAFIAAKAAATTGIVFASEKLWRREKRKAAVVLAVATNIALVAIVANNYRAAR